MSVGHAGGTGTAPPAGAAGTGSGAAAGDNNKKKKKEQMECGESGTYGALKKKTGKGQFDRDHVPSKAALKERARQLNGGDELCGPQKKAVDKIGNAIAIPKGVHSAYSPTYGNKNNPAQIMSDATPPKPGGKGGIGLQAAAQRDTAAVSKGMKDPCKKKYDAWADKINKMTNADYDAMLKKAIVVGK